ncbi:hypothetical protein LguiB_016950 [Lonicera macranthoides]
MDELIELLRVDEPLWIKSLNNGALVFRRERYNKLFPKANHCTSAPLLESNHPKIHVKINFAYVRMVSLYINLGVDLFFVQYNIPQVQLRTHDQLEQRFRRQANIYWRRVMRLGSHGMLNVPNSTSPFAANIGTRFTEQTCVSIVVHPTIQAAHVEHVPAIRQPLDLIAGIEIVQANNTGLRRIDVIEEFDYNEFSLKESVDIYHLLGLVHLYCYDCKRGSDCLKVSNTNSAVSSLTSVFSTGLDLRIQGLEAKFINEAFWFIISGDGRSPDKLGSTTGASTSTSGGSSRQGSSLVTVAFQTLVNAQWTQMNMEAVATANTLISSNLQKIKAAFNCSENLE